VVDFPNQHRALTPALELAAILCHVEARVIANDYTFSFAGRRYQIARDQAQAGMRQQRPRVELRLNGSCMLATNSGTCTSPSSCPAACLVLKDAQLC
jgi:hypothetical protein